MTPDATPIRLLFVINPGAGNRRTNWPALINAYFRGRPHQVSLFILPLQCSHEIIKNKIEETAPHRIVAVGGDGTVKLVAECILHSDILMAIIPAGSANGLARELQIPTDPAEAIRGVLHNHFLSVHAVKINNQYCFHLADIGFNAFVVKKFESENVRGMWGYVKAAWKVFWSHPYMRVKMKTGNEFIEKKAAMIVIANATRYGSGALINPEGKLEDDLFEVVVVKKISIAEIFKMMVTHRPYDPHKTELLQTRSLKIQSKRKVHFQIDGQYQGKLHKLTATIVPSAVKIVCPAKK